MVKKTHYQKKSFESSGKTSDTSANIYESMVQSAAWMDISPLQRQLYVYCKMQYYGEKRKPNNDPLCFTMNQGKWSDKYGLYEKNNAKGFYRDMTALIDHGFIICAECGAATRTKSIYRYSDMWQKYGTAEFVVLPAQRTSAMNRKSRAIDKKQ